MSKKVNGRGPRPRPQAAPSFAEAWNSMDKARRRQIRRLVRIGRPQQEAADVGLATAFADYQRTRPWYRLFWLWFVPVVIGGLMAAAMIHPIVIGMVLAAAGNAVLVHRNFTRVEKVNASLLEQAAVPAPA